MATAAEILPEEPGRRVACAGAAYEDVASHVAELARGALPLRRTIAAVAGRLAATRAWERLGYARLRDYAVERAGVSGRQLSDLARVDRGLAALPGVEAALLSGRLSWTKARLLVRVAMPEDEAAWLARADSLTATALAREVRAVDGRALENGGGTPSDAAPWQREGVRIHCDANARAKWFRARWLARRVAGERLSNGECAEYIAAEALSATPLEGEVADRCAGPGPPDDGHPGEPGALPAAPEAPADRCATRGFAADRTELPAWLRPLVHGLEEADPWELDARLRRALSLEQRLDAEIGPLLEAVARGRIYRAYGFPSLARFAREQLDWAPRRAQALLRLERACTVCPQLRAAYRAGDLSWVQAHALVPLVTLDHALAHRAAWVRHAQRVSVRRLEEDVDRALATDRLDPAECEVAESQIGARPTVSGTRGPGANRVSVWFGAPVDVARLFRATVATIQRRIERQTHRPSSEGEALEAMLEHFLAVWGPRSHGAVPKDHRVFERDGWRCLVPGCSSFKNLHRHHIVFRSVGGPDDDENCITLCAFHHLRGVHGRTLRVLGRAPHGLRFELGVRTAAPPLAVYASGDRRVPPERNGPGTDKSRGRL